MPCYDAPRPSENELRMEDEYRKEISKMIRMLCEALTNLQKEKIKECSFDVKSWYKNHLINDARNIESSKEERLFAEKRLKDIFDWEIHPNDRIDKVKNNSSYVVPGGNYIIK